MGLSFSPRYQLTLLEIFCTGPPPAPPRGCDGFLWPQFTVFQLWCALSLRVQLGDERCLALEFCFFVRALWFNKRYAPPLRLSSSFSLAQPSLSRVWIRPVIQLDSVFPPQRLERHPLLDRLSPHSSNFCVPKRCGPFKRVLDWSH